MSPEESKKVEAYLRKTLNQNINLVARPKAGDSVEVCLGDEFLGLVYRDEDEGEVSYQLTMSILPEDI